MSATYGITCVFVGLALFTATNALRGALFRTGKSFWSSGKYDPYTNLFELGKSLKAIDLMDNGNRNVISTNRDAKKTIYLQ
ncbi:Uncharacterized protein BM_BM393 [Brugia malayi]|uniref:Bm393 n=1 Tax=Brugia malayi TaxID=6279 RepID=A0A0J9XSL6_BRUMA|nr:Uncharacterized protein BM_BM393 [Brugia malayi]CDP94346.2 Bm393 [Brugia malayi]VIO88851.1 Uncharacterized protein BM_BM393 [Brugia malayi]